MARVNKQSYRRGILKGLGFHKPATKHPMDVYCRYYKKETKTVFVRAFACSNSVLVSHDFDWDNYALRNAIRYEAKTIKAIINILEENGFDW